MLENIAMIYNDKNGLNITRYNDSYTFINNMVGGYFELVPNTYFDSKGIDVWCNEEGKLLGLKPCVALQCDNKIFDVVMGNIVFTRHDGEGETISLTEDDVSYIQNWFETTDWHIPANMSAMLPIIEY